MTISSTSRLKDLDQLKYNKVYLSINKTEYEDRII